MCIRRPGLKFPVCQVRYGNLAAECLQHVSSHLQYHVITMETISLHSSVKLALPEMVYCVVSILMLMESQILNCPVRRNPVER